MTFSRTRSLSSSVAANRGAVDAEGVVLLLVIVGICCGIGAAYIERGLLGALTLGSIFAFGLAAILVWGMKRG